MEGAEKTRPNEDIADILGELHKIKSTEQDLHRYKVINPIDVAIANSVRFLRKEGWNAWAFPKPVGNYGFGVELDTPLYEDHIQEQADMLRRVCDSIGTGLLISCGDYEEILGNKHVLYMGFTPSNH